LRRVVIGLDRARRQARRAARACRTDRLALDGALNDAAAALFRHRDHPLAGLDVARASDRIDLDQLPVDIGREVGRVGVHRLGHAHRTTLQQCDTRRCGGKLRDGQFERHGPIPCLLARLLRVLRNSPKSSLLLMSEEAQGQSG